MLCCGWMGFCAFHLITVGVVLLALACWRGGEGDAYNGGAGEGALDGCIECVHVLWQEAFADDAKGMDLLCVVFYKLCLAEGDGGFVLKGETAVLWSDCRGAFGYC